VREIGLQRNNAMWSGVKQENKHIVEIKRDSGFIPPLLYDLFRFASPHGLEDHIIDLLPFKDEGVRDEKGNFVVTIGENPTSLFSSHMDTVHHVDKKIMEGKHKAVIQLLTMSDDAPDPDKGFIWAGIDNDVRLPQGSPKKWNAIALGADDKVGVYIMCKMIEAQVPGMYVFHVGEECGCIGSKWLAQNKKDMFKGIKRAIAFDRKGYTDVIAFQHNSRCASKEFTNALADALNVNIDLPNGKYQGDQHGVFTDTANYTELVPECTNLSVGYFDQHGPSEKFDWWWCEEQFLPAVLKVKWDELPTVRDTDKKVVYNSDDYGEHAYGFGRSYSNRNIPEGKPIAYRLLTEHTPMHLVPLWTPADGVPDNIQYGGMVTLVLKYVTKTPNDQIAKDFAKAVISMECAEMEALILRSKLSHLDKAMGVMEHNGKTIRKLDWWLQQPVLEPEKKNELVLVQDNQFQSHATYDTEGYPKDKNEFVGRCQRKLSIISVFIQCKTSVGMKTDHRNKFHTLENKCKKIVENIKKNQEIGKGMYRAINKMMCDFADLLDSNEISKNSTCTSALLDAIGYISRNANEPGIYQKQPFNTKEAKVD
jgi:hypothetical protein